MNNFTFGNARHQYYETIAGGSGAGPDFDGTERGPDAHDQQPPDRPRNPGDALPGAARAIRDPPRLGRRGRASRRRRRDAARDASSSRCAPTSSPTAATCAPRGSAGGGDAEPGRNWVERADGTSRCSARPRRPTMQPATFRDRDARAAAVWEPQCRVIADLAAARHRCIVVARLRAAVQSAAGRRRRGARDRAARRAWTRSQVIAAFGKAFNDNRYIAIIWIVLPVIGLLERYGLQQRAAALIARMRGATAGRLLIVYLLFRQITAALGLTFDRRPCADRPPAGRADGRGRRREAHGDSTTPSASGSRRWPRRPTMSGCSSARTSSSRSARSC